MPLVILDEVLGWMKLNEQAARLEIACLLFAAGKLGIGPARRLAQVGRIEFEGELKKRGIPAYVVDEEYLAGELKALNEWKNK